MNFRQLMCVGTVAVAALSVIAERPANGQGRGADVFYVDLVPLNNSGVSGQATLVKKGNVLRVNMVIRGYEQLRLHPQHIHGKVDASGNPVGDATCPPQQADVNGDGIITVQEGVPFYGPVRVPLAPFPTPVKSQGAVAYHQTFDLSQFPPLLSLDKHVIVLHGLSLTGNPAIDNPLPVACGEIQIRN